MQIPDLINGLFEACASLFLLNHCRVMWKSKHAYGVSLLSTLFFTLWGFWNVFYYPHLGQMLSFIGGIAVVVTNVFWVSLIVFLRKKYPCPQ